jgi:hypothetical protein
MITVEITLTDWRQIDSVEDSDEPEWALSHSGPLPADVFESVEAEIEGTVEREAEYPRDHDTTIATVEYVADDRSWTIDSTSISNDDDEGTNQ